MTIATNKTEIDFSGVITPALEMSDVEFLSTVLEILDYGWTTGTMCDETGKKCLVGAGAAALGVNYNRRQEIFEQLSVLMTWNDEIRINYNGATSQIAEIETESGLRLWRLLKDDIILSDPDDENEFQSREWASEVVDAVTTFNDVVVESYAALRKLLLEKIRTLRNDE